MEKALRWFEMPDDDPCACTYMRIRRSPNPGLKILTADALVTKLTQTGQLQSLMNAD